MRLLRVSELDNADESVMGNSIIRIIEHVLIRQRKTDEHQEVIDITYKQNNRE